jgi:hypothetical protein
VLAKDRRFYLKSPMYTPHLTYLMGNVTLYDQTNFLCTRNATKKILKYKLKTVNGLKRDKTSPDALFSRGIILKYTLFTETNKNYSLVILLNTFCTVSRQEAKRLLRCRCFSIISKFTLRTKITSNVSF